MGEFNQDRSRRKDNGIVSSVTSKKRAVIARAFVTRDNLNFVSIFGELRKLDLTELCQPNNKIFSS